MAFYLNSINVAQKNIKHEIKSECCDKIKMSVHGKQRKYWHPELEKPRTWITMSLVKDKHQAPTT